MTIQSLIESDMFSYSSSCKLMSGFSELIAGFICVWLYLCLVVIQATSIIDYNVGLS